MLMYFIKVKVYSRWCPFHVPTIKSLPPLSPISNHFHFFLPYFSYIPFLIKIRRKCIYNFFFFPEQKGSILYKLWCTFSFTYQYILEIISYKFIELNILILFCIVSFWMCTLVYLINLLCLGIRSVPKFCKYK